ncbi:hypothetical protein ANO11243_054980 [Dothideomycetidae sp. 11243]|nr:hypothetical protein ANO11243_054980 [fungal sp. No.11243]
MDRLPDELVLHVFSCLSDHELAISQFTCRRFRRLTKDFDVWKGRLFDRTPRQVQYRAAKQVLDGYPKMLAFVRENCKSLDPKSVIPDLSTLPAFAPPKYPKAVSQANWDPTYPGEQLDLYQEYLHRYAAIAPIKWLSSSDGSHRNDPKRRHPACNVAGMGALRDANGESTRIVSPLHDGSICIWTLEDNGSTVSFRQNARSNLKLLIGDYDSQRSTAMGDVGGTECVAIDSQNQRGFFASNQTVIEVDLRTLQEISEQVFPAAVTALSSSTALPLTVATSSTVHIYDARARRKKKSSYAALAESGCNSILHDPMDGSIWVGGGFTNILNYDRRFFPRLRGTIHSGGRISSLSSIPHPFIPHKSDPPYPLAELQAAKSAPGTTLIAAGVYNGKGSLELYGLSPGSPAAQTKYQNRQTAARSKLLSVTPHNAALVISDSDGNIKWFERSGTEMIRTFNINTTCSTAYPSLCTEFHRPMSGGADDSNGDMVRKIMPLHEGPNSDRQNPLLLWTADGKLGCLSFGRKAHGAENGDGDEDKEEEEGGDETSVAQRRYEGEMRATLQSQANEARFMRGLGRG